MEQELLYSPPVLVNGHNFSMLVIHVRMMMMTMIMMMVRGFENDSRLFISICALNYSPFERSLFIPGAP